MATQQTFEFLAPPSSTGGHSNEIQVSGPIKKASADLLSPPTTVTQADEKQPSRPKTPAVSFDTPHERLLHQLRGRVGGIKTGAITTGAGHQLQEDQCRDHFFSTGCEAIDGLLPKSGLRIDAINEWVADNRACGAAALSLAVTAAHLNRTGAQDRDGDRCAADSSGPLVVVADDNQFYPPAAVSLGIRADRIIWVRPTTAADAVWAIDQALRCTGVSAVWAMVGGALSDCDARRFQLAAEMGRTPGFLVRPRSVRGRPTFAEVRFHVRQSRRRHQHPAASSAPVWTVTVDRCRSTASGRQAEVMLGDDGRLLPLPSIASSAPARVPISAQSRSVPADESAVVCLASELAHPTKTAPTKPARRLA